MSEVAESPIGVDDRPRGWRRYVYSTNHKDIGTMFLVFALVAGAVGGYFAYRMRLEMMHPGLQHFASLRDYAVYATGHGIVMQFFAVLPAVLGFGYWMVPLTIGAPQVAFPRLGNLSFWILPFALALFAMSFAVPSDADGTGVAVGWQLIAPLSTYGATGPATDFLIAALLLAILSLLLSAIDFIVTILNMRAPGMTLHKMPLLAWAYLASAFLLLLILPAAAAAYGMLLADRHFGATLFNAAGGGDPLLYQHLFWIFGHSVGTVAVLPAIGMVGHVIAAFARRPVFGRVGFAYAMIATALIGLFGWGLHLSTAGLGFEVRAFFLIANLAVVVPMGVMVLSLIATLWGGSIVLRAPMLWAVGFLPVYVLGGLSGVVLGGGGANVVLHASSFEIAHAHYANGLATVMGLFAGWYFWFPKLTGWRCSELLAKLHFWLTFVGINLAFLPLFALGLSGMPRGVGDYPGMYAGWNQVAGYGAYVLAASAAAFALTILWAFLQRRPAGDNPWGSAKGLEWTLSSPPPYQTFDELPKLH